MQIVLEHIVIMYVKLNLDSHSQEENSKMLGEKGTWQAQKTLLPFTFPLWLY